MKKRIIPFAVITAMLAIGCSMGSNDWDTADWETSAMAETAALVLDYQEKALEGENAVLEAQEYQTDTETDSTVTRSIGTAPEYVLADGTEVFVTRTRDDGETATTQDDILTVEREYVFDDEIKYREILTRPVMPEADWTCWDGDELIQRGTTEHYAGTSDEPFRTGEIIGTWEKDGDEVKLVKIVKDTVHLAAMTTVLTTITFDDDSNPVKEQLRIRVVNGEDIIVLAFTYVQYEEEGVTKTKIIGDDGSYAIRWEEDGSWHTLYYSSGDVLLRERIQSGTLWDRSVTVNFYDETGTEIIDTRTGSIRYEEGDSGDVVVTKTLDDGRSIVLSLSDSGRGYKIEKDGSTYFVLVDLNSGTVTITDRAGNLIGTVVLNDDGSYTVSTAEGDLETLSL